MSWLQSEELIFTVYIDPVFPSLQLSLPSPCPGCEIQISYRALGSLCLYFSSWKGSGGCVH